MPAVIQSMPEVRLVIAGDGEERASLEELASQLGIRPRVEFTGKVGFDDMPAYLKAADLFCFASVTETQGLVTLEALAAGLPVVAVDASGTRDVVENDREGLLTANDSQALSQALLSVLKDEDLRIRYKQAASDKAGQFSIEKQARELLGVYETAAEARRDGLFVVAEGRQPPASGLEPPLATYRPDRLV
jgi:glycosyltransferase involved in cell wall biosynthesis